MLRQLRWLTRPVPDLAPGALAIAVYAEARHGTLRLRAAQEQGFEGIACVDDVARAVLLYCRIWQITASPWARTTAEGLLRFVTAMQVEDGRFANFIYDWDGQRNLDGPTSRPGGEAWAARAMHALGCAMATFGADSYAEPFARGLPWLDRPTPHLDVRAVAVLASLDAWRATASADMAARALCWAEEIAAAAIGDTLPDEPGRPEVHLWGHLQEAALARTGMTFGRHDLIEAARRSAEAVLVPPVLRAFAGASTIPFDVSCAVEGLDALAAATGAHRYAVLAGQARAWFHGRNAAGRPVFDRDAGCVADGIDEGRVSANSGAEANIEGALALFPSIPWHEYGHAHPPDADEPDLESVA